MENVAKPILLFTHVPNTGGLCLAKTIIRHYSPLSVRLKNILFKQDLVNVHSGNLVNGRVLQFDYRVPPEEHLERSDLDQLRVVQGHFRFGMHQYFPRPCRYITILREPVERVISLYYYWRNELPEDLKKDGNDELMTLEEWLESPKFQGCIKNSMTQFYAGAGGVEFHVFQAPTEPYDRTMLEAAKTNLLEHFAVVGIMERFDESLMLMQPWIGWRFPFYVNTYILRKRPPRPPVDPAIREKVVALNQLDIELYQFAQNLFEEEISRQGASFFRDVARFQILNRWVGRLYVWTYVLRERLQHIFHPA